MSRSTVHYADNKTNNTLKALHNKLRPAGTPVQRVEYIIELLLLRIFEAKLKQDDEFKALRKLFDGKYKWKNPKTSQEETNENRLFSFLPTVSNDQISPELNNNFFPFYATILQNARQVFTGNLPQKVQDQLVLIEEVFSNSNFTNNVNSGNLGEVISLCGEIEEERLLKTDLLGDAIESALSETGGTKDIGLHRTPDHIRQFMTALVEPSFEDSIFDPACGTGGFLFDAFEFVMQRVNPDGSWLGDKAHSELKKWFEEYFKFNQLDMPSVSKSKQFYRNGVSGIEYLGMIRKMAAINFYIRGLNPANIEQGDSLAKFNPATDAASKSVVLANPPFGAERDQESYPDVWSEFSKESETTILFVKLMFETLKDKGRCAVIVSEGFHSWDQFSAKALRKMLLDETNLRAVISLPQGLFVSKNGAGPKTSILIFEKGSKTDWVWFYKITNDGFTSGANRKEQSGCQLVECLTLYHEFVKHGKKPPESKHQFCIPAEWIKTLDPRIKEKIRTETRTELEAKGKIEREKKTEELDKKVEAKKITKAEKAQDLKIFEQVLENRITNEIAKRIDKAHLYSFSLGNYKSSLDEIQLQEWKDALKKINPNGVTTLEEAYKKLKATTPDKAASFIAKLNPTNALETDIVREYVSNLKEKEIKKHKELHTLKNLLKSGAKYPTVSIKEMCNYEKGNFPTQATPEGNFPFVVTAKEKKTAPDFQFDAEAVCIPLISSTGHGTASLSRIHFQKGKFALANLLFAAIPKDNQELSAKYLYHILTYKLEELFCPLMKGTANVAMKMEDAVNVRFPLPPHEKQLELIGLLDKHKTIIESAERILENWTAPNNDFSNFPIVTLSDVADINSLTVNPEKKFKENLFTYVDIESVENGTGRISFNQKVVGVKAASRAKRIAPQNSVLISTVRPYLKAFAFLGDDTPADAVFSTGFAIIKSKNEKKVQSKFLFALFMGSTSLMKQMIDKMEKSSYPSVNQNDISNLSFHLPDFETQTKVVEELDSQLTVLEGIQKLKLSAEKEIETILAEVWGEEIKELITEEVA